MPRWTEEQMAAIEAQEPTLLVSAAAGSGKTAVLVERIARLVIGNGARLNRMLIVTFTRAAAAEMRQRLSARLQAESRVASPDQRGLLQQAMEDLESATISTIHAFCQDAIRAEFQYVGVDPTFSVCDDAQKQALFPQAFREAMNALLEAEDQPDFAALAEAFTQRELSGMVAALHHHIMSTDDPEGWLRAKTAQIDSPLSSDHPWVQTLLAASALEMRGAEVLLNELEALVRDPVAPDKDAQLLGEDLRQLAPLQQALAALDFSAARDALCRIKFRSMPALRNPPEDLAQWRDAFKPLREDVKAIVKGMQERLLLDEERQTKDLRQVAVFARGLEALVLATEAQYQAMKREANVIDFNDMEQLTLRILRDPDCRGRLQRAYDYILVDECQDVSKSQNALFMALHSASNHLFMVGDVKQSIYRFRLSDPLLFLHRVRTFSTDRGSPERKIVLSRNFRSNRSVLSAANNVFRSAMKASVTELDYTEEDELVPGRTDPAGPPAEVHLISRADPRSREKWVELESEAVAERIQRLLGETYTADGVERPFRFRDICILISNVSGNGETVKRVLERRGIPVFLDGKETYYSLPEIRSFKALLELIDNPLQDLPLLAVLKMAPFRLTDAQLGDIRDALPDKDVPFHRAFAHVCGLEGPLAEACRAIRDRLADWRFRSEHMQLADFLWLLLRDTGFYSASGALPNGALRQANLRLLCGKAAAYQESGHVTLRDFLNLIRLEVTKGDSQSAKVLGEGENLVRIMTMHKSKGLEFPAVFLMRLSQSWDSRQSDPLPVHDRLGFTLPYRHAEYRIQRSTVGDSAIRFQAQQDARAEHCRLLYVAMTRARERLFLYGCPEEKAVEERSWFLPDTPWRVYRAGSMLDWVMQTVCDNLHLTELPETPQAGECWSLVPEARTPAPEQEAADASSHVDAWADAAIQRTPDPDRLRWWELTEEARPSQPLKTSVSSLTRRDVLHERLPDDGEEETAEEKRVAETITQPLRLSELPAQPAFLQEKTLSAADRGSAMHRLLCLLPLERLRGQPASALPGLIATLTAELSSAGVLSEEEQRMLRPEQAAAFYGSELGQRLLSAAVSRREWRFNYVLPGRQTLLQGVIDCAWQENGGWILLDYKTDRILDDAAFVQLHQAQLNWYAQAVAALTGQPVRERWLYALRLGKAFPVPEA